MAVVGIGILGYWDIGILGYWDIGILGYWDIKGSNFLADS